MIGLFLGAAAWAQGLDLNTATVQQLDELPGLGPAKSEAIVQWRAQHGPCTSPDELAEAPGIGAATLATLAGRIRCAPVEEVDRAPAAPVEATAPDVLPGAVDINSATVDQLLVLPGMARLRAEAILADRDRNGPFASCAELARVPGVGPATIANLGDRCEAR